MNHVQVKNMKVIAEEREAASATHTGCCRKRFNMSFSFKNPIDP